MSAVAAEIDLIAYILEYIYSRRGSGRGNDVLKGCDAMWSTGVKVRLEAINVYYTMLYCIHVLLN